MLRQFLHSRLFIALLIICCFIFIGGIYKSLWHTQLMDKKRLMKYPR